MTSVIVVNSAGEQCSMYENGLAFYEAINRTEKYDVKYVVGDTVEALREYDIIIFNYHPSTLKLSPEMGMLLPDKKVGVLLMELNRALPPWKIVDQFLGRAYFDFLIAPDPELDPADDDTVMVMPRFVPRAKVTP